MPNIATPAFGNKTGIDAAKEAGTLNAYDILYLGDTQEIGWISKEGDTVISTARTQEPIVVNGVTGLGVANGSTIEAGKSIDEIVKMLVQKPVPATYTKPSVALGNNGGTAAGSVEAGTTVTPKLRATFTKNDSSGVTSIEIKKGTTQVATGAANVLDYEGDPVIIGDETLSFTATAQYAAADVKQNNLGQESKENWFDAGTANSSTYSIAGKRNMFYGTGVGAVPELTSDFVRDLVNKKLGAGQGTSFNINVAVGQQYIVIAYPSTIRDINNVTYVEANDSGMAANFTKTLVNVADARGGENGLTSYKVYTYEMAVPASAGMTFKVTI